MSHAPSGGRAPVRNPSASRHSVGGVVGAAGFTLIEVLLATTLLAAGLALGFATVRAAGATAQRGEAMAARNERMRAVSEFLRRRIGSATAIVFALDETTGQSQRFEGDEHAMRFVADLPDYLGRGGPHLHEFRAADVAGARALLVDFRLVLAAQVIGGSAARPPEPLASDLRSVQFAYRMIDAEGKPTPWLYTWQHPEALPAQVRVRMADAQGAWPDVVVSLPLAASFGVAPEQAK